MLYKLLEYENPASSMVFCNTREETRQVYTFLAGKGLAVAMLSSDLPQRKRETVMGRFRSGEIRHMVTTDVASRGIDIEDLSHVFIFSTPDSPEQYIHRAGRTGRVGKSGRAISLLSAHDLMNFNRLVKRYHVEVTELNPPSDAEVQARKEERIVTRLAAEGQALPLEDYAEFSPIARRVAEHEHRDRIISLLLRKYFQAPAPDDDIEEPRPAGPAPSREREHERDGSGRRRRRRRR
jgi:ATP-dependent RNA helicase DeaD